jgi:hypothetical protein
MRCAHDRNSLQKLFFYFDLRETPRLPVVAAAFTSSPI